MSRRVTDFATRFWAGVKRGDPDECWEWQRSCCGLRREYGKTSYDGKGILAHRAAWLLTHGSLPERPLEVCHSCDNPLCCNPRHLWIGTHYQNMIDKVTKGRANTPFGSRNGGAKLTELQVEQIKQLLASGLSQRKIAEQFNVSQPSICYINSGSHWQHNQERQAA